MRKGLHFELPSVLPGVRGEYNIDQESPDRSWAIGIPEDGALSEVNSEAARRYGKIILENRLPLADFQILL